MRARGGRCASGATLLVLQHALLRVLAVVGAVLLDLLCRRVQLVKLLLLQALVQAAASIVPAGGSRNRQWR